MGFTTNCMLALKSYPKLNQLHFKEGVQVTDSAVIDWYKKTTLEMTVFANRNA